MAVDVESITVALVRGLGEYLGVPVIRGNQGGKKPEYPYVTLTLRVTGSFSGVLGDTTIVTREVVPSTEEGWESDVLYTFTSNPRLSVSVTAVDKAEGSDIDRIIQAARDWFDVPQLANRALEIVKAIVTGMGSIEVRDTQLDWEYERRQGFDTTIRANGVVTFREKTIETIGFKRGGVPVKDIDV
jgi:hypothetical protein